MPSEVEQKTKQTNLTGTTKRKLQTSAIFKQKG